MTAAPGQRGQILILLAGFIFFGGGAYTALLYLHGNTPGDLAKAVKRVVTDETHRNAARSGIDQWAKELKAQDKGLGKARKQFVKLARRHDATRMDADAIAMNVDQSIRAMDGSFLDARFRLKAQLTPAEWDAVWAQVSE